MTKYCCFSPSRLLSGPSGGSYSRPLPPPPPPQPPVGIGYGGPYAQPPQQPVAPISSAVKPSYGTTNFISFSNSFYEFKRNEKSGMTILRKEKKRVKQNLLKIFATIYYIIYLKLLTYY